MITTWRRVMKTKSLTFLLAFTFLFLFSGSVYGGDLKDGFDAVEREDYETAYKLLLPFAEQGDAAAQFFLGQLHNVGVVVSQDYKEAVKWYRLSAEQGDAKAQFTMGNKYLRGQGVSQDYKEAVKWFRLSAEQGIARAQLTLGNRYVQGQGVPQDYVSAHMWFNLAGSNGDEQGASYRERVERKMSPSQIEKAQELARNWKPTSK